MKKYDVMIIGGGSATFLARRAILEAGKSVAVVEREALGGTCLNRGCIPSKMLIHPANVLTHAREMQKYGISNDGTYSVDFATLVERVSATVDKDAASISAGWDQVPGLDLYRGHARFLDNNTVRVDEDTEIQAEQIFIAVGSDAHVPEIEGLAGTPYMTSREALRRTDLPEKLLIIGGGYIGCELGHVYNAYGSKTTFFVRDKLVSREDQDVQETFAQTFSEQHNIVGPFEKLSVAHDGTHFTVTAHHADGSTTAETGDALLVATGVAPNTSDLGLEQTAIKTDARGYIMVDDHLQTDAPGVYAFGDCIGRYLFRHSANFERDYVIERAVLGTHTEPIDYPPMPHAMFTYPEIAGVGKTEQELAAEGTPYVTAMHAYKASAQGMARLSDREFVKLIADPETRTLLGAHIVGDEASIMIHQLVLAISLGTTVDDLMTKMIYIHPTLPEVVLSTLKTLKRELDGV